MVDGNTPESSGLRGHTGLELRDLPRVSHPATYELHVLFRRRARPLAPATSSRAAQRPAPGGSFSGVETNAKTRLAGQPMVTWRSTPRLGDSLSGMLTPQAAQRPEVRLCTRKEQGVQHTAPLVQSLTLRDRDYLRPCSSRESLATSFGSSFSSPPLPLARASPRRLASPRARLRIASASVRLQPLRADHRSEVRRPDHQRCVLQNDEVIGGRLAVRQADPDVRVARLQ